MMAPSKGLVEHLVDQLSPLGRISTRRIFGCMGLFLEGTMFAFVSGENRLYVKAKGPAVDVFRRHGCAPYTYDTKARGAVALGYYSVPDDALDDREALLHWARLGLGPGAGDAGRSGGCLSRPAPGAEAAGRAMHATASRCAADQASPVAVPIAGSLTVCRPVSTRPAKRRR
ncbi:TfoX/Sxy family protein [Bordetella sp. 2513F-2]